MRSRKIRGAMAASAAVLALLTACSTDSSLDEPDAAGDYDGPKVQDLVRRLRAADLGADVLVGGPTAELVDTRDALADRAPLAVLVVALLTALLLGRLTRSVVVPIKAVVLNLLSLGAIETPRASFLAQVAELGALPLDPAIWRRFGEQPAGDFL